MERVSGFYELTHDKLTSIISSEPKYIKKLQAPSEQLQLIAVGKDTDAIKYIRNPTVRTQLFVVNKSGDYIKYIKNPSIDTIFAAISKDPYCIKYIDNMNYSTCELALDLEIRTVFLRNIHTCTHVIRSKGLLTKNKNNILDQLLKQIQIDHAWKRPGTQVIPEIESLYERDINWEELETIKKYCLISFGYI